MTDSRYHQGWGVVRYAGIDDPATFDGWYRDLADAEAVYRDWCERFPGWSVALVEGREIKGRYKINR